MDQMNDVQVIHTQNEYRMVEMKRKEGLDCSNCGDLMIEHGIINSFGDKESEEFIKEVCKTYKMKTIGTDLHKYRCNRCHRVYYVGLIEES